jgi:hypothetical protein
VTHLRQIMLEELKRRNYAESTIRIYIHTVEHFSRYNQIAVLTREINNLTLTALQEQNLTPEAETEMLAARHSLPSHEHNAGPLLELLPNKYEVLASAAVRRHAWIFDR